MNAPRLSVVETLRVCRLTGKYIHWLYSRPRTSRGFSMWKATSRTSLGAEKYRVKLSLSG